MTTQHRADYDIDDYQGENVPALPPDPDAQRGSGLGAWFAIGICCAALILFGWLRRDGPMMGRWDLLKAGAWAAAIVFCAACFVGGYFAMKALLT